MAIVADLSGYRPLSLGSRGVDNKLSSPNRLSDGSPYGTMTPLYTGELVVDTDTGMTYVGSSTTSNTAWAPTLSSANTMGGVVLTTGNSMGLTQDVGFFGDSRAAQAHNLSTGALNVHGQAYWAQMQLGGKFRFTRENNFGISSETTTQMVARIGPVVSSNATIIVIFASTNDRRNGITGAQSITNLETMISSLTAAGKRILIVAETPRGDAVNTGQRLTADQLVEHMAVRQWILDQRSRAGVYPIDLWPQMAVMNSTTGDALSTVTEDGLHLNAVGAQILGNAIANILSTLHPVGAPNLVASNADLYNATLNTKGSLTPNPMMDGTGGTLQAGVTGALANSVTLVAMPTGVSTVGSKVTVGNKVWQQLIITGTPSVANPGVEFRFDASSLGNIAIGDVLIAQAEIEVDAGTGYQGIEVSARCTYSVAPTQTGTFGTSTSTSPSPNNAYSGTFMSPSITMPEAPASARARMYITLIQGTAVNLTVRVRALALRKA